MNSEVTEAILPVSIKMGIKEIAFLMFLKYCFVNSSVLLVSNRKFQVSPLEPFSNQELNYLRSNFGYPNVSVYITQILSKDWQGVTPKYYTSFNPNGIIYPHKNYTNLENHTVNKSPIDIIQTFNKSQPFLLAISNLADKRLSQPQLQKANIRDPVLYIGFSNRTNTSAMLYSSRYIKLRTPKFKTRFVAAYKASIADTSNTTIFKLHLRTLRGMSYNLSMVFSSNYEGYWKIPSIILSNSSHSNVSLLLEPIKKMLVLNGYAFICGGMSRFVSRHTGIEIDIYDIHIDPHARNQMFSMAYSCNDYVSPAIVEGLCVSLVCIIGLAIGFSAMSSIKHT